MKLIPIPSEPEDAEIRAVFERIAASRGWVSTRCVRSPPRPKG
ncbi:hypothetical protein [Elioraea tepidiphila]|jgi:hypothetical protein|nr:hypothetical protein [Elioraea tepidiphila]